MRGVKPRMPPLGWDAEHPKPELDWRRKKEIIGGAYDDDVRGKLPPAFEYLTPHPVLDFPVPKPPPINPQGASQAAKKSSQARSERAAIQKRYRIRDGAGLACYELELPKVDVEIMLQDIGFLAAADADDRVKVRQALQRFNLETIREHMAARYK
jgi:hypothetical protein